MEHWPGWFHPPVIVAARAGSSLLVVAMIAAGCSGRPKEEVLIQITPKVAGTLTVATTLPAPGFWEGDDVSIVGGGYEWGLARSLADEFDLDLKVVDVPFADIVEGRLEGADMALAQIEFTVDRSEVLDFSLPYYASDFGVLMLAGERLRDVDTARELRWTVIDGARQQGFLAEMIRPTEPVRAVTDDVAAADAIRSGTVDAALIDLSSALIRPMTTTVSASRRSSSRAGSTRSRCPRVRPTSKRSMRLYTASNAKGSCAVSKTPG